MAITRQGSFITLFLLLILSNCSPSLEDETQQLSFDHLETGVNVLDYSISPQKGSDRDGLMYSDQGAWFAYSFPDSIQLAGFSGPFLMTQQNGVWAAHSLAYLDINDQAWKSHQARSYNSHLEQVFKSDDLELKQRLVFHSGHTAFIQSVIRNISDKDVQISFQWKNRPILADSLTISAEGSIITINSQLSTATGYIQFPDKIEYCQNNQYATKLNSVQLSEGEAISQVIVQSFIFPRYNWDEEKDRIDAISFEELLLSRKQEKEVQIAALINNRRPIFRDKKYAQLLIKAHLTLQNNWRIPAGEIKHAGLFPSYHYVWFNGFWSWDSWKHSVGLSYYDLDLAKDQIRLMFDFQDDNGFVADCVFRDTSIEAHNYRDTKPPLAAWAAYEVFEKDKDLAFIQEIYPKLKSYHLWWYQNRDHDQDGICEFGSTDGSLVAAKWESGMDNAIRFDQAKVLKNSEGAYSLDQESVDLNAYLYAEKQYLAELASSLKYEKDALQFRTEAKSLKSKIWEQFYDEADGWFYDTSLDGQTFIKGEGSEGWTSLWAKLASPQQAERVKAHMMDTGKFFTKVPFQTMSAGHPKFDPLNGYWRGPCWLDQAYFGVKSLRNYNYEEEADLATIQILEGASGLLEKGPAIRENYHPLTGEGLHAHNFSWSAAHIIMLLSEE